LGVEPGPGHARFAADGIEGDALTCGIHASQCGDCALAGLFGPALGGRDDVVGGLPGYERKGQ
jgi:hypothetical protein